MVRRARDWTDWTGGYEDLVEAARELLELTHDPERAPRGERESYERAGQLNERLVRQYVSTGVVSPGERSGREVVFNFRHLLQLVAARHLLTVEGWKLPLIARFMAAADIPDLRALLPSKLADEIFRQAPGPMGPPAKHGRGPTSLQWATPRSSPAEKGIGYLARDAWSAAGFRRELEGLRQPPVEGEEWLRFRLTEFTEVHVRADALDASSDKLVEDLADNLKRMLRAASERRRRGKR